MRLSTGPEHSDDDRSDLGDADTDVDQGRPAVIWPSAVRQRLDQAGNLPEILDAVYDAFTETLSVIRSYQESGSPFYAALVMATAAAADGRDAVGNAPSLPPLAAHYEPQGRVDEVADPKELATFLSQLSVAVAARLRAAAAMADITADRQACEDGARYAGEIHSLATGTGP